MRREDIDAVRVLLAIDESAASQAAVNEVLRRLWPADTTVRVLHVVEKFVPPAQELWYDAGGNLDQARQEIKARFRSLVEETAARVVEHNLNSEISIRDGNAGKVIVQEAKEWNADVIFVGSRGHVTLKRLLTGSVSHYVVDNASCPVEVVHQKQGEQ
jgi:nucleotide-binding universal stress UspA family protein